MRASVFRVAAALAGTILALPSVSACSTSSGSLASAPSGSGGLVKLSPAPTVPSLSCGAVPAASGPLTGVARLELRAPATATAGIRLEVSAVVIAEAATSRVITVAASSAVFILKDGSVVGVAAGSGTSLVPLALTAGSRRGAQAVPSSVPLAGCEGHLQAGDYGLVAVLAYRVDPLTSAPDAGLSHPPVGRTFALVSSPTSVIVT